MTRAGVLLCLALAAVVLGADHQEYRALTPAGMHALVRGALPLLALASLHLLALDAPAWLDARPRRALLAIALLADVAVALAMLGPVRRGASPAFWIALGVACVLAGGAASLLLDGEPEPRT